MSTIACREKAIPELADEMTETDREGYEMPRLQSRRLPSELLIAIADHVGAQVSCRVKAKRIGIF